MVYDTLVVGLGAMGSAITAQLARRGQRVAGCDQYAPPHIHGSTHGDTRVTRLAIGEGEHYVPLVQRSHQLWRDFEQYSNTRLLQQCGALIIGTLDQQRGQHGVANFLAGTIAAAERHGIEYRLLDPDQLRHEYPQFATDGSEHAYFESEAGYVRPEKCVLAQLRFAAQAGAALRYQTRIQSWTYSGSEYLVQSHQGTIRARRLVLSAGAWVSRFLKSELADRFQVYRQVQMWVHPRASSTRLQAGGLPVFIWVGETEEDMLYGVPPTCPGGGIKLASESFDSTTDPDTRQYTVTDAEQADLFAQIVHRLPDLAGSRHHATSCLYTCTADFRFVIDRLPGEHDCWLVSPCSGHGFKHSAGIGDAVANWITSGERPQCLAPFALDARTPPVE